MNALIDPPLQQLPRSRPRPAPPDRVVPALDLPTVSFFGRSLAEYTRFFALDLDALKGRDVLDVGAGPSSFTAEACQRKIDAAAVDPFYGGPVEGLAAQIDADYERMFAQMRAKRRLFRVGSRTVRPSLRRPATLVRSGRGTPPYFESLDAAEADRRAAAQRFIGDYATHYAHGRYVGSSLPRLPFFDRTFDLVLCAHLLFVYSARFDFDWHLASCRELVRVSDGEVRIHPLVGADGRPYDGLAALRRDLRSGGIESDIVAVDYEFFAGANSMLVLRRA